MRVPALGSLGAPVVAARLRYQRPGHHQARVATTRGQETRAGGEYILAPGSGDLPLKGRAVTQILDSAGRLITDTADAFPIRSYRHATTNGLGMRTPPEI